MESKRNIGLSSQDITQAEIDAVVSVMKSSHLSLGPTGPAFEKAFAEYIGRKHAIAVNSGTSALFMLAEAYGLGPGDEVITTPFSFIATSNIILMTGAKPVFVDIDPVSYNLTAESIESKISSKTKAIIPVEVFGNPIHLDEIADMAKRRGLICIEDSCEALGSIVNGRKSGTLGDSCAFAFYPNKQMTTGEGGIILTDDDKIASICRSLRNQGRADGAGWLAHARLGYNYRLSDINSALGLVQIGRIEEFIAKRERVAQMYMELLGDEKRLHLPVIDASCRMSWFVFVIRLEDSYSRADRDGIMQMLRDNGIGCNNYFSPIHLQPFMQEKFGTKPGDFPITEHISDRTIALPFHNNLPEADIEFVCNKLRVAMDKVKG